jgi:hypothetical protein
MTTYKCKYCGTSLSSKERLYEHLKRWHAKLKDTTKKKLLKRYERR